MTGLFGWFGALPEPAAADSVLADMRVGSGCDAACNARASDFYAGVCGDAAAGCHQDDDCIVLVSDTRAASAAELAARWRRDGERMLEALHGPFALALLDRRRRRLLLAVDRAGARSLYLLRREGCIGFATRLQALTALPGPGLAVSDQALFEYLYFHMIPSPGTIYSGVTKLLPAQVITFGGVDAASPVQARFYWRMPYRDGPGMSGQAGSEQRGAAQSGFDDLKAEFRGLLPQVVGDAGAGDGRVGCFLSGGTDSSTVTGTWRQVRGEPVPSYSMGFDAEGYDEMAFARVAARHFATTPREYYVRAQDVVEAVPQVAAFCDEPFGNASIVPAYLCARFARSDGMDAMLAGDGGDEIFGGNERYANQWLFEQWGRLPRALRRGLAGAVDLPGLGLLPPVRKARSYIAQAEIPLPDRFETYNFLHRTPLAQIFEPDFLARVDTGAPLANLREVYGRAASRSAVNRMMHLDLKITLADNDLRKVNQACQLAGVDVRYPLLDDRMLAFAASVPPTMQLKRAQLRWFFKRALADFLPAEIIAKRKQGFGLPVGLWMREYPPLRELAGDSISTLARRGIVRADYIDWVRSQHQSAHASYYGVMLWVLVMLEQWLQSHRS
ncbi:asparagine synthase [Thiohalocapsa halophila]|uniref:asparagine synthase (glutamine-hydrolyzing) n=1 Tax=Thiohalocapsa halophila TaxID=69359 RepID=A0ABS1CI17_9GAMM|nr:asparagine synthase C-terminal domain-containing protein [Thiohalocapsa halophila]MBK1631348.1 asparagine synthase [Thiohalocapsa halophila]